MLETFSSKGKGKQSSIKVLQEVRSKREIRKDISLSVSPSEFLVHQFQTLTQSGTSLSRAFFI